MNFVPNFETVSVIQLCIIIYKCWVCCISWFLRGTRISDATSQLIDQRVDTTYLSFYCPVIDGKSFESRQMTFFVSNIVNCFCSTILSHLSPYSILLTLMVWNQFQFYQRIKPILVLNVRSRTLAPIDIRPINFYVE